MSVVKKVCPSRRGRKSPHMAARGAFEVLGLDPSPDGRFANGKKLSRSLKSIPEHRLWDWRDIAQARYRDAVMKAHPDKGGTRQEFTKVLRAWKYLQRWFAALGVE